MGMTQEDKELLLKDLCARLPYGVKVEHLLHSPNNPSDLFGVDVDKQILYCDHKGREEWYKVDFVKPYLRPMSSMTEEEEKEFNQIVGYKREDKNGWVKCDNIHTEWGLWLDGCAKLLDWLNAHHFDYRELIEKGLAIEVPEGMYKK